MVASDVFFFLFHSETWFQKSYPVRYIWIIYDYFHMPLVQDPGTFQQTRNFMVHVRPRPRGATRGVPGDEPATTGS